MESKQVALPNAEEENQEEAKSQEMSDLGRIPAQGSAKPTFDKITTVTIKDAVFRVGNEQKPTRDGKSTYFPFWLSITYEDSDGNEFYESFGGGHRSPDSDWVGTQSALGEFVALCKQTFDYDGSWKELIKAIKGSKVGIITENRKGSMKNMVRSFK